MRFESFLWVLVALLLTAGAAQTDTTPLTTDERYQAADGGSKIPPE